jgi:hypothetical protein
MDFAPACGPKADAPPWLAGVNAVASACSPKALSDLMLGTPKRDLEWSGDFESPAGASHSVTTPN